MMIASDIVIERHQTPEQHLTDVFDRHGARYSKFSREMA
jgi:hypothetical protein